jgi:acyl-CoA thioesterase FadM
VSDVVFKRPVRLDEVIRVEGELTAVKPIDEAAGLVDFRWSIRNQQDALVARASVQVLWAKAHAVQERSADAFWHELVSYGASPDEFTPLPL